MPLLSWITKRKNVKNMIRYYNAQKLVKQVEKRWKICKNVKNMIRYYNPQKLVKQVEKRWKIWLDIIMPKNWLNKLKKRKKYD